MKYETCNNEQMNKINELMMELCKDIASNFEVITVRDFFDTSHVYIIYQY